MKTVDKEGKKGEKEMKKKENRKRGVHILNYMVTNQYTSEKKPKQKTKSKTAKGKGDRELWKTSLTSKEGGGMGCKEEKAKIGWNP